MNENQMLPMQKDETVAKLYALRAGLSVMAENVSEIKALEKNNTDNQNKIKQLRQQIENCDRQIEINRQTHSKMISSNLSTLRQTLSNTKSLKTYCEQFVEESEKKRTWVCVGLGIIAIFCFILPVVMAFGGADSSSALTLLIIGIIVGLLAFIPGIAATNKMDTLADQLGTRDTKSIQEYIETSASKIKQLESSISYYTKLPAEPPENEYWKNEKLRLSNLLQSTLSSAQKEEQQNQTSKLQLEQESKDLYQALLSTYTPLIVEEDWKNIDLLIFYLETGRAESWKEALQLTDRQLQTNQITQAIEIASQSISKNMLRATQALGNLIMQSCSEISKLLLANNEIAIENEKLQNALFAKANQSSERIIETIKTYLPVWR